VAGKGTPDSGATFTIAQGKSRSVTRSGRAYNRPLVEPSDDSPEPTTQEPTPGPTPGSAHTPARTSHLLQGDLDTDSDADHDLTAVELIQRGARRIEERAAARTAAHQASESEHPPERPSTSRWRAPTILGVFGSQTPTRVPFRQHREQSLPGTFIPDTPERPSRSRSGRQPPEPPDPPPPDPDPPTNTMADPGPTRLPPPKLPKPLMFSGEGEDVKPDKLKRWLRTVKKHLARLGLNDDSPGVADYYGAYTDGKANNAYQTLDREMEDLTLAQLTQCLQQLSEAFTNTDDTYHRWQNIRQTAGGQPARITKIAGELVVFVTGRSRAGFHSPDPAFTRGRGGMFRVIPSLSLSGAHPHSFPGRGPVCYHLFLTGTRLGYGWGGGLSGDRGRECRKRHPAPGR